MIELENNPDPAIKLFWDVLRPAAGCDFRQACWGWNQAQVLNSEDAVPAKNKNNIISYLEFINKRSVLTMFFFLDDRFSRGRYQILNTYENPNNYFRDYKMLRRSLLDIYDTPIRDDLILFDLKNPNPRPSDYGQLVHDGMLSIFAEWQTDKNRILLGFCHKAGRVLRAVDFTPMDSKYQQPSLQELDF